jgi:putative hydrolase of the HAD superfamily
MFDWSNIDTVLLDMDGTLLDLHFDNHFWLTHVPHHFANKHGMGIEQAMQEVLSRYREVEGSLDWYCVDYWSDKLGLDIVQLKHEVSHKISIRPQVIQFLEALRGLAIDVRLVTNAHEKAIQVKMRYTGLAPYFNMIVCSHDIGAPKEAPEFWSLLHTQHPFDSRRTLFIDDNLDVLRAARGYGVRYLFAIYQPDSQQPVREVGEFGAIRSFDEIMPKTTSANTENK